ncbi:MAG: hypothetical protein KDC54_08695, partial [Lewinella sp.]|nr:hypothetical protein [Lewinella sp.]
MSQLLYYLLIKPLSLLPLSVLHGLSTGLYWLIYRAVGYRKSVVRGNLERSFPEKTPAEIAAIMDDFYRRFCDIVVETIRLFSMSEEELRRRCPVENPEVWNQIAEQGKGFIVFAGHTNNWEFGAQSFQLFLPESYRSVGFYAPLKNDFLNRKMQESRGKFGMWLVSRREVKPFVAEHHREHLAYFLGADQAPKAHGKTFWMTFLHQETPIAFGPEKFAKEFDLPVVYAEVKRYRRGYYGAMLHVTTLDPAS